MALSDRTWTVLYAVMAIAGRVGIFIDTPLWVDYLNPDNATQPENNITVYIPEDCVDGSRTVSPYFIMIGQSVANVTFFGIVLGLMYLFASDSITDYDTSYPKKYIAVIGFCQGISSILFNFAISGKRTAPYLQIILSNCVIPIQFIIRFLVLHKRPTCVKLSCAVAVMGAEFMCLIPRIFPELESAKDRHADSGASGVAGILWPLALVSSQIPFCLTNAIMERIVKSQEQTSRTASAGSPSRLNMIYFLFWWTLFAAVTIVMFWWMDIVPGYGTSANIKDFGESMWFNLQSLFGQSGCGPTISVLGWANLLICAMANFAFVGVMRVSEGANFLIVVLTLRTPIVFLFWTLFEEHPFKWRPHADLSTWLCIAGIVIMLPAVIVYEMAPPEKDHSAGAKPEESVTPEREPILEITDSILQSDPSYVNYATGDIEEIHHTPATNI